MTTIKIALETFHDLFLDFHKETREFSPNRFSKEKAHHAITALKAALSSGQRFNLSHDYPKISLSLDKAIYIQTLLPEFFQYPTYLTPLVEYSSRIPYFSTRNPEEKIFLEPIIQHFINHATTLGVEFDNLFNRHKKFHVNGTTLIQPTISLNNIKYILNAPKSDAFEKKIPSLVLKYILTAHNISEDEQSTFKQLLHWSLEQGASISDLGNNSESITIPAIHAGIDIILEKSSSQYNLRKLFTNILDVNHKNKKIQQQQFELIQKLVAKGALNNTSNKKDWIYLDSYTHLTDKIITFLKEQGLSCVPHNEHYFAEVTTGEGMFDLILAPSLINERRWKYLNNPQSDIQKIPAKIHHIWLTSPDKPSEVRPQDIENVIKTKKLFNKSNLTWEHILWTNDRSLIPASIEKLQQDGIQVIDYHDYQNELHMVQEIDRKVAERQWGEASDTLRCVVTERFGGVYADLNFVFYRHMEYEVFTYHFITMTYSDYHVDNFFFAASPHHPIMQKAIELIYRNFVNPPHYIQHILEHGGEDLKRLADLTTAEPISIAYYTACHKNGNIDVVYSGETKEHQLSADGEYDDILSQIFAISSICNISGYKIDQPTANAYNHIIKHEHCPTAWHVIGTDSTDGLTWL